MPENLDLKAKLTIDPDNSSIKKAADDTVRAYERELAKIEKTLDNITNKRIRAEEKVDKIIMKKAKDFSGRQNPIEAAYSALSKGTTDPELVSSYNYANDAATKLIQKEEELKSQIDELNRKIQETKSGTLDVVGATNQYKGVLEGVAQAVTEGQGSDWWHKDIEGINQITQAAEQEIDRILQYKQRLEAQLKRASSFEEYSHVKEQLDQIPQEFEKLLETAEKSTEGYREQGEVLKRIVELLRKKAQLESGQGSGIFSKLGSLLTAPIKLLGSLGKGAVSIFGTLGNRLGGLFKNIGKGANKGIASFKRLTMAMIGARSIYTILSKAVSAYMSQNEELGAKLSTIWTTLGNLLGPIIEKIINLVLKLAGYFVSLLKVLGLNTKATNKQAKASAAAAKANERQLAAFDEMNKLSDSSGGGGSGSGANNYALPEFDIDLQNFGKNLAEWLNKAMASIDWDKIQNTLNTGVKNVVEQLNDFVETLDWKLLGQTIANGLNTAVYASNTAIRTLDWRELSDSLGEGFASLINGIDWGALLQNLVEGFMNLASEAVNAVATFLENLDLAQIGESLGRGLIGIDWAGIAYRVVTAVVKFLVEAFIVKFIKLPQLLTGFLAGVFESLGMDGIAGFFKGITDKLSNIGTWIRENIYDPFINWFKSLFGIHSPSTVMQELGTMVIQGLLDGISSLVGRIGEIWTKLKEAAVNVWTAISTRISEIVNAVKDAVVTKFTAAKDTAINIWLGLKSKVQEIFGGIWSTIKSIVNSILGGIEKMANGVVDGINTVIRAMNRLKFNIPSWVPGLGGKSFGFSMSTIGRVSIPRLAQGAVIPPNREFMAILGDQKHGTNIEAPLDTIVEAFKQVQGEGNNQPIIIELKVDGKTLARTVTDANKKLGFGFNG